MSKKPSKTEARKQISEFFANIDEKTDKDIKKIKRLAMKYNIPLKEKRKLFCKKCLVPYKNSKTRVKDNMKRIKCGGCGYVSKWKLND